VTSASTEHAVRQVFCPATMCPFFAKDGSPWTGDKDAPCEGAAFGGGCGWGESGFCLAGRDNAKMVASTPALRVRAVPACNRAGECAWQAEAAPALCAPRAAFVKGLDPRGCAY